MLGSLHRFHGPTSLGFVYKRGQVVRGAQLSLKYVLNQRRNTYRIAVVVSRKVDKSAVVRNRIRRRIYEIVRGVSGDIHGPYDIVFTVFSNQLATSKPADLQHLVRECMEKAGILPSVRAGTHAIVNSKGTE